MLRWLVGGRRMQRGLERRIIMLCNDGRCVVSPHDTTIFFAELYNTRGKVEYGSEPRVLNNEIRMTVLVSLRSSNNYEVRM